MQLSAHFWLREFTRSQTASRHGVPNEPNEEQIGNLIRLCTDFLEPIRTIFRSPIVIHSGFRSRDLNQLIGGSRTSSHMDGDAADLDVIGKSPLEVCQVIEQTELEFDQVIHEFGEWVHLGVGPRKRRQSLTAYKDKNNKTRYSLGLHKMEDLTDGG